MYEGMAKWAEIQYAYLYGEAAIAKREEIATSARNDENGRGFLRYLAVYPMSRKNRLIGMTPFDFPEDPLKKGDSE